MLILKGMDELIIEEKKYISSKRAAKITGYAKDYIGQLCREGRVPARLVGRSWYVLETALQDHRFGTTVQPGEAVHDDVVVSEMAAPHAAEYPRYEAFPPDESLPSINRLKDANTTSAVEVEELKVAEHLQDSWKEWFDHVADTVTEVPITKKIEPMEEEPAMEVEEKEEEGESVNIPIHTVYELPQPHQNPTPQIRPGAQLPSVASSKVVVRIVRTGSILLAAIMATIAVMGSGYFDKYLVSVKQVQIITGAVLYNK